MKINVWHGLKHEDFAVTEVDGLRSVVELTRKIMLDGYFTTAEGNVIPWHNITYIEKVEE